MELQGTVQKVIYKSENQARPYCVFKLTHKGRVPITAVVRNNIYIGEYIKVSGTNRIGNHGEFLDIDKIERIFPHQKEQVIKFLSSDLIKGLGKALAARVVEKFGDQTYNALETRDRSITDIKGISLRKAESIWLSYEEYKYEKNIVGYLLQHGLSLNSINKIRDKWGPKALQILKQNPYALQEIPGFGFMKADSFALFTGIDPTSIERVTACTMFILENSSDGHTYYTYDDLKNRVSGLIIMDFDDEAHLERKLKQSIYALKQDDKIKQTRYGIHSMVNYNHEMTIAKNLIDLISTETTQYNQYMINQFISGFEARQDINLSREQKLAVKMAFSNKVSVITGGPGTGKTMSVGAIIEVCENLGIEFALAAPTGRAAKRMTEQTGYSASTLHRLLEYKPGLGFMYNKNHRLPYDLFIIDEVSMIDISLMDKFTSAVMDHGRVVFLGDIDQLASVGVGDVLHDIIESNLLHVSRLTRIYRQGENSFISVNAHKINKGSLSKPLLHSSSFGKSDFIWSQKINTDMVLRVMTEFIPKFYNIPVEDVQLLTPFNKGGLTDINTTRFNYMIQQELNPKGSSFMAGKTMFKVGDRVMQTQNNYDKNVFNGDIGYITCILSQGTASVDGSFVVKFKDDDKEVTYYFNEASQLKLAYASSIHRFQGSESRAVIVVIPELKQHNTMLRRNLAYTAITRARELCVVFATSNSVTEFISNNYIIKRRTALKGMLLERFAHVKEGKRYASTHQQKRRNSFLQSGKTG